jgi:hypothetical protein
MPIVKKGIVLSRQDFIDKTNNKEFIYVRDIKKTLYHYGIDCKSLKRPQLIQKLTNLFDNQTNNIKSIIKIQKFYRDYINRKKLKSIIKIQKCFRDYINRKKFKYTGLGFYNKKLCVNYEDFYTLESYDDIDPMLFFSLVDNNKIFYFDIRSLDILLQNNQSNPFTTNPISQKTIRMFLNRIKYLKEINYNLDIDNDEDDIEETKYKKYIFSIFQKIDALNIISISVNTNWFLDLNYNKLFHYYYMLEDIWNYRAPLTPQDKYEMIKDMPIFQISAFQLRDMVNTEDNRILLQKLILNEIDTLISTSDNIEHRKTCAYYVLIALTSVSTPCALSLPWLNNAL